MPAWQQEHCTSDRGMADGWQAGRQAGSLSHDVGVTGDLSGLFIAAPTCVSTPRCLNKPGCLFEVSECPSEWGAASSLVGRAIGQQANR